MQFKAIHFKQLTFRTFTVLFLACSIQGIAQNSADYAESISQYGLKEHLSYLASDELEGRETATKGQYMAAQYIADHFNNIGLQRIIPNGDRKSYFQWFEIAAKGKRQKLVVPGEEIPEGFEVKSTMNVVGLIEGGSKKNEYVVITAHYDHLGIDKNGVVYNGADDDGSGTAAVMEIAEAFAEAKKNGHGPARSILFMLVAGEEKGLLGSRHFTDDSPAVPLDSIVCNLNIDMIGRQDKNHETDEYIYIIGADKISQELHDINESVNSTYTNYLMDYTYNFERDPNRFYYRSDHYNFAKNGIPVIFYFTGVHEDYHKPEDDVEKIHFPKYSKIVKHIFLTAWEVSNLDHRLIINENK
ncbi:M28 family peptidase [Jiulongibacter sp. NS-SX5]|uniref:M28 family peptidase n=1 Tax=Jiulongibacter sp. NS-SX5 TaxID=3463854 RepID=UPI004058645F